MKLLFPMLLLVLFMISGCEKKDANMEAKAMKSERERVKVPLHCSWQSDPDMRFGGLIRGEGSSGASGDTTDATTNSITVNLPVLTAPTEPVMLTSADIIAMDITIITGDGETLHFGDDKIQSAAYLFEFNHVWPDGSTVTYVIAKTYTGD